MNNKEILGKKTWAVIGVNKDISSYGYKVFSTLLRNGNKVYGINPKYNLIDGHKIFSSVNDIEDIIDVAVFVVNPKIGISVLDDIIKSKIKIIWCQPGSSSPEIIEKCEKNNIQIIQSCIMVESGL